MIMMMMWMNNEERENTVRHFEKKRNDVQLTGCPVTWTRQMKLDQMIPAVGVSLCLQFENQLKWQKTHTKKNVFLLLNPLTAENTETVKSVPNMLSG